MGNQNMAIQSLRAGVMMIIMVIRIVLVLLDILDYVKSRPVAMGNSSEIEVLPWTNWDSFPRWDAGHSIALASFHSVMTHRQKRKMNNRFVFCGWLVSLWLFIVVLSVPFDYLVSIWFLHGVRSQYLHRHRQIRQLPAPIRPSQCQIRLL